jgi:hypothetical protein
MFNNGDKVQLNSKTVSPTYAAYIGQTGRVIDSTYSRNLRKSIYQVEFAGGMINWFTGADLVKA